MSDTPPPSETPPAGERPTQLGVYDSPESSGVTEIELIAIVLSVIWLIGSAVFFLFIPNGSSANEASGGLRFLMTMLAIFMPIAMIWVGATAARASRVMREESQRLQAAIDGIRHSYIAQQQTHNLRSEPNVARKLDEIAAATRKTETALATFQTRREGRLATPSPLPATDQNLPDDQRTLPLGTQAEDITPPLSNDDFVRALNFPETAEDEVGFTALRRALNDRSASQLVQAAQDVLTLLSQDGIYMDDLLPDRARPDIWRAFGQGTRGRAIAPLGGIRDRSSLALTSARMKQDTIFRDAAHHFLRRFDQSFSEFEKRANDEEIIAVADTRTARAFMLLGRVTGTFD